MAFGGCCGSGSRVPPTRPAPPDCAERHCPRASRSRPGLGEEAQQAEAQAFAKSPPGSPAPGPACQSTLRVPAEFLRSTVTIIIIPTKPRKRLAAEPAVLRPVPPSRERKPGAWSKDLLRSSCDWVRGHREEAEAPRLAGVGHSLCSVPEPPGKNLGLSVPQMPGICC